MFYFRLRAKPKVSTLTKLTESLLQNLPINPTQLRQQHQQQQQRQRSDTSKKPAKEPPKTYNTPHPPKDPPDNYNPMCFGHVAFDAPDYLPYSIWRPFKKNDEQLGPKAAKSAQYKNPEYYSYHRYSFVEIQQNVLELRKKRMESGGEVVTVYDYEVEEDVDFGVDGKVSESTNCDDDAPKSCDDDSPEDANEKSPKKSECNDEEVH